MKIEFETDINGYQEARKFKMLVACIIKNGSLDASLVALAESLQPQLDEFLSNPEFADFNDNEADDTLSAGCEQPADESFKQFFRRVLGPGKREIELSKQRRQLIIRAERAEASAFEALAETAAVGRERDRLKEKLKRLEADIKKRREGA